MNIDNLKTCPICNANFECNHLADCWCTEIQIPKEILIFLKQNFDDCLCEKCLRELILKQEKS